MHKKNFFDFYARKDKMLGYEKKNTFIFSVTGMLF